MSTSVMLAYNERDDDNTSTATKRQKKKLNLGRDGDVVVFARNIDCSRLSLCAEAKLNANNAYEDNGVKRL
jgi:hypothetical protein